MRCSEIYPNFSDSQPLQGAQLVGAQRGKTAEGKKRERVLVRGAKESFALNAWKIDRALGPMPHDNQSIKCC